MLQAQLQPNQKQRDLPLKHRHRELLRCLENIGELDLVSLKQELNASESTIRRDLQVLEQEGLLVRTFGGARLAPHKSLVQLIFGDRTLEMLREKRRRERSGEILEIID